VPNGFTVLLLYINRLCGETTDWTVFFKETHSFYVQGNLLLVSYIGTEPCILIEWRKGKGKGKAAPLLAWGGPEGSRKLRFSDFMITAQDSGKFVSLTHRLPLPPGNTPGTHFCWRLSRSQGHSAIGSILCQRNIPMTPAGIEPATFWFVAQHLNHCATAVPNWVTYQNQKPSVHVYISIYEYQSHSNLPNPYKGRPNWAIIRASVNEHDNS